MSVKIDELMEMVLEYGNYMERNYAATAREVLEAIRAALLDMEQRERELVRAMSMAALKLEADGDEWGVAADLRYALAAHRTDVKEK
jgi:hypothetical protein